MLGRRGPQQNDIMLGANGFRPSGEPEFAPGLDRPLFTAGHEIIAEGYHQALYSLGRQTKMLAEERAARTPLWHAAEAAVRHAFKGKTLELPPNKDYLLLLAGTDQIINGKVDREHISGPIRSVSIRGMDYWQMLGMSDPESLMPSLAIHLGIGYSGTITAGGPSYHGYKKRAREVEFVLPADSIFGTGGGGRVILGGRTGNKEPLLAADWQARTAAELVQLQRQEIDVHLAGDQVAELVVAKTSDQGPIIIRNGFLLDQNAGLRRHSAIGHAVEGDGADLHSGRAVMKVLHPDGKTAAAIAVDGHTTFEKLISFHLPRNGNNIWVSQSRISSLAERVLAAGMAK